MVSLLLAQRLQLSGKTAEAVSNAAQQAGAPGYVSVFRTVPKVPSHLSTFHGRDHALPVRLVRIDGESNRRGTFPHFPLEPQLQEWTTESNLS